MRLAEVVAAAGAITALIAGTALFDEFGPGALVAVVGGLAVLVAASLVAQRLRRTVRYRIDRPNSTVWLTVKVACLLGGLAGAVAVASAVDAPSLPRTVIVVVVVGALAGVVNAHTARWTLFQVDATGLRLGRATVPWSAAARLDLAGAAPGTVEIGVQLAPGQVVGGTPAPGTVLVDLPVCTTVPATTVHVDHVRWAVREFGNPAIPVVVRHETAETTAPIQPVETPAAPPAGPVPPPARSRRGWLVAGALGLVAVLAAGVVTAVVVLGDAEPGTPSAEERRNTYTAAGTGNLCHLVDVDVLASWSTEKDVLDESGTHTEPGYETLSCGAQTGGERPQGRFAHFTLSAVVADDAATARTFLVDAQDEDRWDIAGNEEEKGTVDGLGDTAEYEQAVSVFDGNVVNEYVLVVRDDNLVLVTRFRAESDGSDGDAPGIGTLADTAIEVARGVMTGLRAPAEKTPAGEDAAKAAATAPGTEKLMARIRAADPCEPHLHAAALLRRYGQVVPAPKDGMRLTECGLVISDGRGPVAELRLGLDAFLSERDRAGMTREVAGDQEVYHERPDGEATSCSSFVPYDDSGFGAKVSVERVGADTGPAPCEVAERYTGHLAELIASLPARAEPAGEPSLEGDDPCAADAVAHDMPGWEAGPVARYRATHCRFTLSRDGEHYEFDIAFEQGGAPSGDERVRVGMLAGKRTRSDENLCGLSVSYLPSSFEEDNGQNIDIYVKRTADDPGAERTHDVCDLTETAATAVVDGL